MAVLIFLIVYRVNTERNQVSPVVHEEENVKFCNNFRVLSIWSLRYLSCISHKESIVCSFDFKDIF